MQASASAPPARTYNRRQSHWRYLLFLASLSMCSLSARGFVQASFKTKSCAAIEINGHVVALRSSFEANAIGLSQTPKARKGRKKRQRKKQPGQEVMTESDIQQHVAEEYLKGSQGSLKDSASKSTPEETTNSEQSRIMKRLDRHPTLVLNADYQPVSYLPLSLWHWQEAIKSVFTGKVTVVDIYPDVTVRAASVEISLPSVIALNEYVRHPNSKPAFTKRNVFLRDEYQCQYCSRRFHSRDLSLDHVLPRSKGGSLSWENAVACCHKCNSQKGSLTLNQLGSVGMKLAREPFCPTQFQLQNIAGRMLPRKVHSTWAPFLSIEEPELDGIPPLSREMEDCYLEDVA